MSILKYKVFVKSQETFAKQSVPDIVRSLRQTFQRLSLKDAVDMVSSLRTTGCVFIETYDYSDVTGFNLRLGLDYSVEESPIETLSYDDVVALVNESRHNVSSRDHLLTLLELAISGKDLKCGLTFNRT